MSILARLAITRHRLVLWISAAILAVLAVVGLGAFSALHPGGFDDPSSESSQAKNLLERDYGGQTNLVFLVTARTGDVDTPTVARAAGQFADRLAATRYVAVTDSYWAGGASQLRSSDGRSGLVTVHVAGDDDQAADRSTSIIDHAVDDRSGAIQVRAGGQLGVNHDTNGEVGKSLGIAEAVAIPLTLLLLLLAFGSLLAASLPLVIGLFTIAGTFAELDILGHATSVSVYALNLTTALGLGLSIDYSLLIVNRFREELRKTADVPRVLEATMRTAGRTIVFSSATVAVALAALLIFPLYFLRSFAYAGIGVTVIAMLSALVVLPALLATFGTKVARGRKGKVHEAAESTVWRRIATVATRRPLAVAVAVVGVLIALGTPFLHATFSSPDDRVLRDSTPSRQVGDALRSQFAGSPASSMYAVVTGGATDAGVNGYARSVSQLAGVTDVSTATGTWTHGRFAAAPNGHLRSAAGQLVMIDGPADTTASSSQDLVRTIRGLDAERGFEVRLGGPTPALVDGKAAIADNLPWAVAWIALTTFILLFLFTGSVLIPLKALLLNVLSLGAVFGAMVWIFQDGHLAALLDVTPGPMDTSMPILLFCIAFGLSMDYEVFLLSRIKELHDAGADTQEAVIGGLARTGRIVSTAAALLAVTFFAIGTGTVSFIQFFGIGTGLAIVLDATVVRGLLVPAFMALAGSANWWAPGPLRRVHRRIGLREATA